MQAAKAVAERPRRRPRLRRQHRSHTRRRHAEHQADQGVHRPALAVLVPIPGKPVLFLDCGANVEVRPEHLVQFAYMGAGFMEAVHGVDSPSVGLLSVGEEQGKGTPDVLEAGGRLEEGDLDFVGNLEGFDLPGAGADVIVSDGFTGNVARKVLEGTSRVVRAAIRERIRSGLVSSLGGLLIKRNVERLREEIDPEAVGGAILLGLRKRWWSDTEASDPRGSPARSGSREEPWTSAWSNAPGTLEAAGALRSAGAASVGSR